MKIVNVFEGTEVDGYQEVIVVLSGELDGRAALPVPTELVEGAERLRYVFAENSSEAFAGDLISGGRMGIVVALSMDRKAAERFVGVVRGRFDTPMKCVEFVFTAEMLKTPPLSRRVTSVVCKVDDLEEVAIIAAKIKTLDTLNLGSMVRAWGKEPDDIIQGAAQVFAEHYPDPDFKKRWCEKVDRFAANRQVHLEGCRTPLLRSIEDDISGIGEYVVLPQFYGLREAVKAASVEQVRRDTFASAGVDHTHPFWLEGRDITADLEEFYRRDPKTYYDVVGVIGADLNSWRQLTEEEADAANLYKGPSSTLNPMYDRLDLRLEKPEAWRKMVLLANVILTTPARCDMIVWHGFGLNSLEFLRKANRIQSGIADQNERTIEKLVITSTSLTKFRAEVHTEEPVLAKIRIPRGTPAFFYKGREAEIMLAPGTPLYVDAVHDGIVNVRGGANPRSGKIMECTAGMPPILRWEVPELANSARETDGGNLRRVGHKRRSGQDDN